MKRLLTVLGCSACMVLILTGINYRYEGWVQEGYTFLGIGIWSSLLLLQELQETHKIQEKQLGQ